MDFPLIDGFSMKETIHFWGISSILIGFSMKEAIQRAWGTPMTMETPRSLQYMPPPGHHITQAHCPGFDPAGWKFWAIRCFTDITMATVDGPAKSVHHQFFQRWETSKHPMILCFNHPNLVQDFAGPS
jgi:hypothetical protein